MHSILVVDDNIDACEMLAKLLTMIGDKAVCVCCGQAALDSLRKHIPRLVILDVMMPGMDGIEVLRRIRADPRTAGLPVIMFSAVCDPQFAAYAKSEGANEFWVKGEIDFSTLHRRVAPYMDAPAAAAWKPRSDLRPPQAGRRPADRTRSLLLKIRSAMNSRV
jgi:CheY-like chemotaxis protein